MRGITFNGQHTFRDLGLTLSERHIGLPAKRKMLVQVPFSNIEYDMSTIYGAQPFENRILTFTFNVFDILTQSKDAANTLVFNVTNSFMSVDKFSELYDDADPGYFFLAEIRDAPELIQGENFAFLTLTFEAYPFRLGAETEGNVLWDTFNFLTDVMQQTEFTVSGSLAVTMHNIGVAPTVPEVDATAPMTVTTNGRTINFPAGRTKNENLLLLPNENDLVITGNGTIKFIFRKEVF